MIRHRFGTFILLVIFIAGVAVGQTSTPRAQWWFGGALGANINSYSAELRNLVVPPLSTAFSGGGGVGLSIAPVVEYLPDPMWGGMLHLGFDSRNGSFDDNASGKLSTVMNYLSVEPSVRLTPFESGLHFFAGPRIAFNVGKSYTFTPASGSEVKADWSDVRGVVLGAQIGAGYDIDISSMTSSTLTRLTPFVAAHVGMGPRSEESWSIVTLRLGVALKFGSSSTGGSTMSSKELGFSVRAPRILPTERKVKETFPVRNYVFFDEGSTQIPARYVRLTETDASSFNEEKFLQPEPRDLTGRSKRQMTVYRNLLNILGDRMRRNPSATVSLLGSSPGNAAEGRLIAEAVKNYLTVTFGINEQRISVDGKDSPAIPSAVAGGTRELELVRPEDRRVEIRSSAPLLLEPVQIISLQEDQLESDVIVNLDGAEQRLSSWNVEVTDEKGVTQRFGPFTSDQERIPGRAIIGSNMKGNYILAVVGQGKNGQVYRNQETIRLVKSDLPEEEPGLRFSILFEFDQSKTVSTYDRFLTGTVAPLIPEGGSVIIHGHTDIVGEESHNLSLSRSRAQETMRIFERELAKAGKKRVTFDAYGFGEDVRRAPFDNKYPEERFYNRTVIIDIIPE